MGSSTRNLRRGDLPTASAVVKAGDVPMKKPKVLFLDDSPTLLAQAEKLLGTQFDVVTASDWIEANRLAHRDRPDLVVIDWKLNGFEGSHLVRAFRMFFGATLPIVMISSDDAGADASYEAQADSFVPKRDLAKLPAILESLHSRRLS